MMKQKSVYSPSKNAIYPAEFYSYYDAAGVWPADGIEISDEDAVLFNGSNEPSGKMVSMVDGKLCWIDRPAPVLTTEELIARAEQQKQTLRQTADAEIAWRQDAVDVGIATDDEALQLTEWKRYRVLLMRVDTSKAPDIEWPTKPDA